MTSDSLTKALGCEKHQKRMIRMGMSGSQLAFLSFLSLLHSFLPSFAHPLIRCVIHSFIWLFGDHHCSHGSVRYPSERILGHQIEDYSKAQHEDHHRRRHKWEFWRICVLIELFELGLI